MMKKIIEYDFCYAPFCNVTMYRKETGHPSTSLEYRVQQLINEGWQPFGSIFKDMDNNYVQPMVKYEEPSIDREIR